MTRPRLFVLSAPSGAGKSTLIRRALAAHPEDLVFSVSATTRKPRAGEAEGREYYFKTREEFERMIAAGELAEYQVVYGNYYGTPKKPLLDHLAAGRSVILDIDVYGKKKLDRGFPDAVGIFITVPDTDELRRRLEGRGTEGPDAVAERLRVARAEIEFAKKEGKYEYTLVNTTLDESSARLLEILSRETEG
ncbi:MAG: guanylate kinase [Fibrobacterota bacterium]